MVNKDDEDETPAILFFVCGSNYTLLFVCRNFKE